MSPVEDELSVQLHHAKPLEKTKRTAAKAASVPHRTSQKSIAYHSPPAEPSPLLFEESWVLPAAAEAKLDGSGVGIMKVGSWATDDKNAGPVTKEEEVRGRRESRKS